MPDETELDRGGVWSSGGPLFPDELALVGAKTGHTRLGFAVMLRFFAGEGPLPARQA